MEASGDRVNTSAENIPSAQGHTVPLSDAIKALVESGRLEDALEGSGEEASRKADEFKARQQQKREENLTAADGIRRNNADIVERARALFVVGQFQYADVKKVRQGDSVITQAQATDTNKWHALDVLFGLDRAKAKKDAAKYDPVKLRFKKNAADEKRPHLDEFSGRIVDHEGNIMDDHYAFVDWVHMFNAAQLKGLGADTVDKAIRAWALEHRWNSLIERLNSAIPTWDGVQRMESKLIDLFKCFNTPLNRSFGQYFWLSLYARLMHPGAYAPMILSLFGTQDCGKSYFGKRLCEIIIGNDKADTVQLNLDGEKTDFLREITGNSIIAAIGEMTGFTTGDLNRIKNFVTRPSDMMHYKHEGHFDQQRQWIAIMDGNKYEGLQRDTTGNRRFYPMFCGQLPDQDGQPRWSEDFNAGPEIHSGEFEADVWQLLAEAKKWFGDNGNEAYVDFAKTVSKEVFAFNAVERAANRGTVHDPDVDTFLTSAVVAAAKRVVKKRDGSGRAGVVIRREDLILAFKEVSKINNPNQKHIETAVCALGAATAKIDNRLVYYFDGYDSVAKFDEAIGGDDDANEVVEKSELSRF
jgi:hypothetical protein